MNSTPKVSVIIPVYNTEKYLRQCLDSVINQTLKDIEIICVDDASEDSSMRILEYFSKKDSRVKTIHFTEKRSALVARKKGIEIACGHYIMFIDSDDYLETDACEILYDKITSSEVDILHFSSKIENCAYADEDRIRMNEDLLRPYERHLKNGEIFNACFVHNKFGFTLWNKIYSTELCKKAFECMEESYLPKAQDLYSFFVIAYFAKSYLGWNDKPLYHYCFGRGVTGKTNLSLNVFERYCYQSKVIHALNHFLDNQKNTSAYQQIVQNYANRWLKECATLWFNAISPEDEMAAFQLMCKFWGNERTVIQLANLYWYSRDKVANRLKELPQCKLGSKIHTIVIYYYHFTIGGIQRVISILIDLFQAMGYHIILVTDKETSQYDIASSNDFVRTTIFDYQQVNKDNIDKRIYQWKDIIEHYSIDLVIYNAWTSPLLLWDMLYLKSCHISVIVQTHSIFSYSLTGFSREFATLPPIMRLADGIIVLSNADLNFWSCFNSNVHHIPNPILPQLYTISQSSGEQNLILWIGRFSNEKQPWEAIKIMEYVVKKVPDAVLYMIGDSSDPAILEKHKADVRKKGLENNISFLGYQKNIFPYFEKAKVNLITSRYEGFSMVLIESQANGVPTVMYNMPYLDIAKEKYGVIGVEPQNKKAAANAIVELLTNSNSWHEKSNLAYQGFQQYSQYDYQNAWRNVLNGERNSMKVTDDTKLMIETIISHYSIGWERNNWRNNDSASPAFALNTWVWPIRIIYGGIRCYKENGLRYTLRRIHEKFHALIGR